MNKTYQVKIYSKSNVYKSTISPKIIMSEISFSETMNWWQWQLTIGLNLKFTDTTYIEWDLIKVYENDTNNTWLQIYYGFISKIVRWYKTNSQTITLVCLWIASLLKSINYTDAWYTPTENQDPAQTIKDSIDYFNTQYSWTLISYSWWNIDDYWSSINIEFDYTTCFDVIKKVAEATDFRWHIDWTWQVRFKTKPTTATHKLTNQSDVETLQLQENVETVVNKYFLERNGWTIKTYEDATSQTTYWIKEKKESKTDIQDEASQDIYWADYISENKDPKSETKITINSKYNLESIKPWDTIKVENIAYTIDNLQVLKVSYSPDKVSLTIEKLLSFGKEVVG